MKQILIQMPEKKGEGDPDFLVMVNNVTLAQAAGVMLTAYQQIAEEFVKNHPPTCLGCDAYVSHLQIKKAVQDIIEDIQKHPAHPSKQ